MVTGAAAAAADRRSWARQRAAEQWVEVLPVLWQNMDGMQPIVVLRHSNVLFEQRVRYVVT